MKVYLVTDEVGSHEPDAVFSVWDSREGAQAEIVRFRSKELHPWPCLTVVEVEVNQSNDNWINPRP